jgi:hypothetical protein
VRDLFGLSEINNATIPQLAKAVRETNTPGLYHRILEKCCHIHWVLTCIDQPPFPDDPIIKGITQLEKSTGTPTEIAEEVSRREGSKINTLRDAIEVGQKILRKELNKE